MKSKHLKKVNCHPELVSGSHCNLKFSWVRFCNKFRMTDGFKQFYFSKKKPTKQKRARPSLTIKRKVAGGLARLSFKRPKTSGSLFSSLLKADCSGSGLRGKFHRGHPFYRRTKQCLFRSPTSINLWDNLPLWSSPNQCLSR